VKQGDVMVNVTMPTVTPPNLRLQPTAFGAGMRGALCHQSFWLARRVLPESAAEPRAVGRLIAFM